MFRLAIAMVVIGGVLLFLGFQELRLAAAAKSEPQDITCAALEANGPGDNAHVNMTDFFLVPHAFVYESSRNSSVYKKIWIPALPLEGEYHKQILALLDAEGKFTAEPPPPSKLRIIVKSSHVPNDEALTKLDSQDSIQGLIINTISSLGGKERKILQDSYPGVDFSNVYILEHQRKPASSGKMITFLGLGVVGVLAGGGLGVMQFMKNRG